MCFSFIWYYNYFLCFGEFVFLPIALFCYVLKQYVCFRLISISLVGEGSKSKTNNTNVNYITHLRFVSPCIIVQFKQITNQMQQFFSFYPDVYLQLNMFQAFSRPSSGARWLQWQTLVLPSYRGDSRTGFVVGPAGPTTNRGCHCSHWAPNDGRENARNMLSCKQTSG
jgi:hypothetical protein